MFWEGSTYPDTDNGLVNSLYTASDPGDSRGRCKHPQQCNQGMTHWIHNKLYNLPVQIHQHTYVWGKKITPLISHIGNSI